MRTIGFPISKKENENRRVLLPKDIINIGNPEMLFFEEGYGQVLNISDENYVRAGCNIVSHETVLKQDVICDPKAGDANYLKSLKNQIVFGWIHATQNRDITDSLIENNLTAIAWENMFYKGRHIFWRNNELAGEAAVLNALQYLGRMPYETKVAIIGRGNTARGALKMLNMLGADVIQYNRTTEKLLRDELPEYDIVVNCVLWDVMRKDHIIYRDDLKRMKPGSMIIDVSCDKNGAIETSIPTTIEKPTYLIDGIVHYVVDHTPSIFHKTFTNNNSEIIYEYLNELIVGEEGEVLKNALVIDRGKIVDEDISKFQLR